MAYTTYWVAVDVKHSVATRAGAMPLAVAIRYAARVSWRTESIAMDVSNTFGLRRIADHECD
jgi:hypothetical protein